jgi:hypothetical protein
MRAVTLQAVSHPRQVQPGDQRQVVVPLVLQGKVIQRRIVEQHGAVDGGHERGGVGHQPVARRDLQGASGLLLRDARLLVRVRRAALAVAPFAQVFTHRMHWMALRAPMGRNAHGQRRLTRAFGPEQSEFCHDCKASLVMAFPGAGAKHASPGPPSR